MKNRRGLTSELRRRANALQNRIELRLRLRRDRRKVRDHPFYQHFEELAVPWSLIDPRVAVDTDAEFVYYRIPKAANSTVTWSLFRTRGGPTDADIETAKGDAFLTPSHLDTTMADCAATSFLQFTVVRNPYTRLASAYLDKIAGSEPQCRRVAKTLGIAADAIKFSDFIDYLEHCAGLHRNAHWAPQADLLPLSPLELDLILYTEDLDRDLPRLLRRLYPERTAIIERCEHKRRAQGDRDARKNPRASAWLETLYDDALRRRVRRLYERDFEAFGYDPERVPT